MGSQRILLGLVFGLMLAGTASGQVNGQLRWRGGASPLGLQPSASEARGPCGSIAFPCEETTSTVRLYTSTKLPSLGVYGRLGTPAARAGLAGGPGAGEGGVTYGIGLSWNFSRRGSAILGWDSYDLRTLGGETRDVRATSLGLRWRY